MTRVVVILVLAALVVLAALTAFGSFGGWVAGVVLVVTLPLGSFRRPPLAGAAMIVLLVVFGASLIPAVRAARGAAMTSSNHCRIAQLLLALHNYHDSCGVFPPAFVADDDGRPMHSWRTLVLPYIEEGRIYDRYDFDEPWDGPNNRRLADEAMRPFRSSVLRGQPSRGATNFVAVVGPETAWPGPRGLGYRDLGGLSRRILLVETYASDIHWMEPRDLTVAEFLAELAPEPTLVEWWLKLPPPGWRYHHHSPGRAVGMADGRARFVHGDLTPEAAQALVRVDVDSEPYLDALDGRQRLPAAIAALPVTEDAIRWGGFFTLLAAAVALLIAVHGVRRPWDDPKRYSEKQQGAPA